MAKAFGLEPEVARLAREFAVGLCELGYRGYRKDEVVTEAMTSIAWHVFDLMPDQREALITIIQDMPVVLRGVALKEACAPKVAAH